MPKTNKSPEERFWEKVDMGDSKASCWTWTAAADPCGYGYFGLNGKIERAHRVSWMWENGDIPEGKIVMHHCDNPPCVNPLHLRMGTHKDNVHDMIRKGRHVQVKQLKGHNNPQSKLTRAEVKTIRELWKTHKYRKRDGNSQPELAKRFNVSTWLIAHVVYKRRYQ